MTYKVISDSSINLFDIGNSNYRTVPLHVIVGDENFIDNKDVDINKMQKALESFKGKTSTACPGPQEWIDAFEGADVLFCVTITSTLSGSFSSANIAKQMYKNENKNAKVYVIDSLSAGPELVLIVEKLFELLESGMDSDEVYREICLYQKKTHLYYSLASLDNLAKNGRISPIVAKGVGLLGIRVVGRASDEGTLEPLDKCRGDRSAFKSLVEHFKKCGYCGGKVVIAHNDNESAAKEFVQKLKENFGEFKFSIHRTSALCSYYAEPLSLMIGFEA